VAIRELSDISDDKAWARFYEIIKSLHLYYKMCF